MIDLADEAVAGHLHSGCGLLVGTIGTDGRPRAARAWGLTIVDPGARRVRLLIEADDVLTLANLRAGGRVAITGTSVQTFTSIQLKGRCVAIEAPTEADEARRVQYTRDFLDDITVHEGYPMEALERWADHRVVPCVVEVDSSFDQTPGPSAGVATGATGL